MKKRFRQAIENPLIAGSIVVFLGTFAANIFNFLFNFFMTRNLSIVDYGTLAALASIILLFALVAESLTPMVVNFTGSYFARREISKVIALFWKLNTFFVACGAIILVSFVIFAGSFGRFFKINNTFLLFLLGVIIFFVSVTPLNKGILMGRLSFKYISFLNFFSSLLKFLSGIFFVLFGLGVIGGLFAFLLAYVSFYLLSFFPLRFVFQKNSKEIAVDIKKIFAYAVPSSIAMLGLTLFITTDLLLVKHFYPPSEAGIYAGMSLLGRIIYFFTAPISTVLFPLVVQKSTRNEKHDHLFFIAMGLVGISSLGITIFYYIFPEFSILTLLKQKEYLSIASSLWIFGIFMTLYSLLWLMTNYYLSARKTKVFLPIIAGTVFQAIALWFYHGTFITVILISILAISFPLCMMFVYHWRMHNKRS